LVVIAAIYKMRLGADKLLAFLKAKIKTKVAATEDIAWVYPLLKYSRPSLVA
jgi:hypothetical protein